MPPAPDIRRPVGGHNTTARFYALRARTRSARVPVTAKVPMVFGIPSAPRKEDVHDLRHDVLGPVIRRHLPVVPDGSRKNLIAAFDKRCNHFDGSRVDDEVFSASLRLLDDIAPRHWDPIIHDRDLFDDWNSQFGDAKRLRHSAAFAKISDATQKDFSDKQIFVKVEALLKRHDPNWAPRIIYQSSDLHNVLLGPVMWKCTKRMFASFSYGLAPRGVFRLGAYGAQTDELASFIQQGSRPESVFLESDFSSNDMTQVKDVHMLEVAWLERLGAPQWLTALMLVANSFRVRSVKHSVKASIENQLPTGAQSTTFRNSMWNASINYRFCERVGAHGRVLILGDDMIMRLDNPFSSRDKNLRREYQHVCRLARMDAKVKCHRHLSEASFLSKHFIMTDSGNYVMAPFLGKAVARFNVRASSNEAVSDEAYLAGKCLSYAYEFRGCPTFAKAFMLRFSQLDRGDLSLDALSWNAKGAFLELGVQGVVAAIDKPAVVATASDLTRFYHWKYGLTHSDIMVKLLALLFGEEDLDLDGLAWIMSDVL